VALQPTTAEATTTTTTNEGDGSRSSKSSEQATPRRQSTVRHYYTSSGVGGHATSSLVIATLQATGRVMRLLKTATLMAIDYKTADWGISSLGSDVEEGEQEEERNYWEIETENRRIALEEAQGAYSKNSHPELDVVERLERKRQEKVAMNRAAEALAEAEDQLVQLGSRKGCLHRGAADRLLKLCHDNKGVYIKVGQHLANLDYLIPQEYIEVLSALYDDNPVTPFEDAREVIREDLGRDIDLLFDDFNPIPIASASLAQVHIAYDKTTGRKLAVKVQHRGLRETSVGDIYALVKVVRTAERLFANFTWGWLADEIAPQLPKELDFENEGRNAERAARNIAATGLDCVVPKIVWKTSSPRVLTMEYEEGCKATDIEAIEKLGLKKHDVAKLMSSVFSSQIFSRDSFVHVDPHPANVGFRRSTIRPGKPAIVLYDHGLYRELDSEFRLRYAELWKSLMLADLDGIKSACEKLGVDKAYGLFTAILTSRPFDELVERSKTGSLETATTAGTSADKAVIRGYAHRYLHAIIDLLGTMPRQMLLLLKMNDCLRHIDHCLGSPTNTMIICGYYAAKSIYEDCLSNPRTTFLQRWSAWLGFMRVVIRIRIHDAAVWGFSMR